VTENSFRTAPTGPQALVAHEGRKQPSTRSVLLNGRAELALAAEPLLREKAKANQRERKGDQPGASSQKSDNLSPIDTKKELAKLAHVSHDTIAKAKVTDLISRLCETVVTPSMCLQWRGLVLLSPTSNDRTL